MCGETAAVGRLLAESKLGPSLAGAKAAVAADIAIGLLAVCVCVFNGSIDVSKTTGRSTECVNHSSSSGGGGGTVCSAPAGPSTCSDGMR